MCFEKEAVAGFWFKQVLQTFFLAPTRLDHECKREM